MSRMIAPLLMAKTILPNVKSHQQRDALSDVVVGGCGKFVGHVFNVIKQNSKTTTNFAACFLPTVSKFKLSGRALSLALSLNVQCCYSDCPDRNRESMSQKIAAATAIGNANTELNDYLELQANSFSDFGPDDQVTIKGKLNMLVRQPIAANVIGLVNAQRVGLDTAILCEESQLETCSPVDENTHKSRIRKFELADAISLEIVDNIKNPNRSFMGRLFCRDDFIVNFANNCNRALSDVYTEVCVEDFSSILD